MSERLDRLAAYVESIIEAPLPQLHDFYAPDVFVKNRFNEVRDVASIEHIFPEMYVSLHNPRCVIHSKVQQGFDAFRIWEFNFCIKKYRPFAAVHI